MIRVQIRFGEQDHKSAKRHAKRLGISLSEFVRRVVLQALSVNDEKPWMHYTGFVESGDPCASQTIDDVVYR